jgi:hypothetical protein
MTTTELILNKYNIESNYIATFDEIINDFHLIEPTKIPIVDISIMTTISKYIYEFTNYHKWNICPNLEDEIIFMITRLLDEFKDININIDNLKLIFGKYKNKKNYPTTYSIEKDLLDYIEENNKHHITLNDLLNLRKKFRDEYKLTLNKYNIDFNEVEIKIDNIVKILSNKFETLEGLPEFEDSITMLENVNIKVSKNMEKLISFTNEEIKKVKENFKFMNDCNSIILFEELKKEIMNNFDKQMDLCFENEIKSLNFNDSINNMLFELYDIEKAMYRCSISLYEIEDMNKNIF